MGEIDARCAKCGLYQSGAKCPNMEPSGSEHPLLYVLGMAPGVEEDRKGKQFLGKSGKRLRRLFKRLGVNIRQVRWYNVVNCLPPNNKFTAEQLAICSVRAREDIRRTKPKVILVLGTEAANGLWPDHIIASWKMSTIRGAIVPFKLTDSLWATAVPTYHPSYIIRQTASEEHKRAWETDVSIAWDWANGTTQDLKTDIECFGEQEFYNPPKAITIPRTFSQVKECLAEIKDQPVVAWDWEAYQLAPWKHLNIESHPELFSVGFALPNGNAFSFLLGSTYWSKQALGHLYDFLGMWLTEACPDQIKVAHSLKFELLWSAVQVASRYQNVPPLETTFTGKFHDTKLLAWLLDGRTITTGLKAAAWFYLGIKDWSVPIKNIAKLLQSGRVTVKEILTYNSLDAWWTLQLFNYFKLAVLNNPVFAKIYYNLTLPSAWSFLHTELRGKPVDTEQLQVFKKKFDQEESQLLIDIRKEVGSAEFNPKSPEQLAAYWVDDCKYKLLRKTKKSWSVDAETVDYVLATYNDGVASKMIELRKVTKLNSTYVTGLLPLIFEDVRLHSSYSLTTAITGRTSCSKPNDQNFPKRKYKELRKLVIALYGYVLASFDYGQLEGRLLGVLTGDRAFCEALWHDYDIHLEMSTWLFDGDTVMGAKMRSIVKNIIFGIIYGGGPDHLSIGTGISSERIAALRNRLFRMFPGIKKWQQLLLNFERVEGYVESLFGVRRRSPMAYSEILNHPNQSTASDMTKASKNALYGWQDIILFIHDDLSFMLKMSEDSIDAEVLFRIARGMLTIPWLFMKDNPWFKTWVPMAVVCEIGSNWCDLEKVMNVSALDLGIRSLEDSIEVARDELKFLQKESHFPLNKMKLAHLIN